MNLTWQLQGQRSQLCVSEVRFAAIACFRLLQCTCLDCFSRQDVVESNSAGRLLHSWSTMTTRILLKGRCAHTTARHFWRRQLCTKQSFTSARCSAIREAQNSLRKKDRSASDILEQHLHNLESTESVYHAFLSTDVAAARAQVIMIADRLQSNALGSQFLTRSDVCRRKLWTNK